MNCVARSCSTEGEWSVVSERNPCAICGGTEPPCSGNAELSFVVCARSPSDWLLTTGAWLHPVPVPVGAVTSADEDFAEDLAVIDDDEPLAASGA